MQRSSRRLLILILALALLIIASAGLYMVGMSTLEGQERGFWRSLEWAGETLSTTGYGSDNNWTHPVMVVFVVALQFVGVLLVFLLFPVYLIPALEERFQARLPTAAPKTHQTILILRYDATVSTLVGEIEREGLQPLLIEGDENQARSLIDQGRRVVFGKLNDALTRIDLSGLVGVVANAPDDENATAILTLRQLGYESDIFALVEEPYHRKPVSLAGANGVFTPRHILAAALAARASDKISPRVRGVQALGDKLVVSELKIGRDSPIRGTSLRDARVGGTTGVTVIGAWVNGKLIAPVDPDLAMSEGTILVAAGTEEKLHEFAEAVTSSRLRSGKPFFVAGYGEVGRTMTELLLGAGESVVTLDQQRLPGVDIVGNIDDHVVLESSKIEEAQALVLAVGSDSATLFATLMVKDFAPHLPIIARVNQIENVERMHRAGADFALSIGQVSGQLLAARLLHREAISIDQQLRIVKTEAAKLAGKHPKELGIREHTGASVVAVEREDRIDVGIDDDFLFTRGDTVYVAGSFEATERFLETFGDGA